MGKTIFEVKRTTSLLDFLIHDAGVSKRLLSRLKRIENGITRNGTVIRTIDTVNAGDNIVIKYEDKKTLEPNSQLKVPIAFENENLVIFDKPAKMPVHPSIRHQGDTLGNCFAAMYPKLTFRPVNRLDRDTSGLCLVAKNAFAAAALQNCVNKIYYAVVMGCLDGEGTINLPIAREQESIIKRTVSPDGQRAVTHYKVLSFGEKYSFLEIRLETGRTHQIRVHFSYMGYPLAGDDMYGGSTEHISRQALHCGELEFKEPLTDEKIIVKSPVSNDIKNIL